MTTDFEVKNMMAALAIEPPTKEQLQERNINALCAEIKSQKNIIGLKFIIGLIEKFPMFKEEIESLATAVKYVASFDNSILDRYYKSEPNEAGSIKLAMTKEFKEIISKTSECKLKIHLLSQDKVKKGYLTPSHLNFFSADYDILKGKIVTTAYSRAEIEAKLDMHIMRYICQYYSHIHSYYCGGYGKTLDGDSNYKRLIYDALKDLILSTKIYKDVQETRYTVRFTKLTFVSYTQSKENTADFERSLNSYLSTTNASEKSMSSVINGTFDHSRKTFQALEENTKILKVHSVNPISGLATVKNSRERKESSSLNEQEIAKTIREATEINKFFEEVGQAIKAIEIISQTKNEVSVEMVNGAKILALYNISSYKGNEYNYKTGSDQVIGSNHSGSLFNSCMRMPEIKPRLSFYAKNTEFVKMLVCTTENGKRLAARAIVWYDKEKEIHYVDRIFSTNDTYAMYLINYINTHENVFSIAEANNSMSSLLKSKRMESFLIKFNGSAPTKCQLPYFDTLSSNLYYQDGEFKIGKCREYKNMDCDIENAKKGVVYTTSLQIQDTGEIDLSKFKNMQRVICPVCGDTITTKSINFNGHLICLKHIERTEDGEKLITSSFGTAFLESKDEKKEKFIMNAITKSGVGIVKQTDCKSISFTQGRNELLRYMNTINVSCNSYSQKQTTPLNVEEICNKLKNCSKAKPAIEKIFGNSNTTYLNEHRNMDGKTTEQSRYEILYSTKELTEFAYGDRKLIIPKEVSASEMRYLIDLIKADLLSKKYEGTTNYIISNIEEVKKLYHKDGLNAVRRRTGENESDIDKVIGDLKTLTYRAEETYNVFYQPRLIFVEDNTGCEKMEYFTMKTSSYQFKVPVRYLEVSKEMQEAINSVEVELKKLIHVR